MEALAARSVLGKALLLLASLILVFCAVEFLLVPQLLVNPPHRYQGRLSLLMQVLSQHSRRGVIPEDYILLVGDSNAKGYGDWLNRADPDGNDPYHSAHVLHERTGRDVLSYGKGGAGSIGGLVLFPARWDRALERFDLEPPDTVLVYFYDGNDLNDNLRYLSSHYEGEYDAARSLDPEYLRSFLAAELDAYLAKKSLIDATLTVAFVYKNLRGALERWSQSDPEPASPELAPQAKREKKRRSCRTHVNRARIAGEEVEIPDGIQSPALELSPQELDQAMLVTRLSLERLAERYAGSDIHLIRLPSPLSSYTLASEEVEVQSYMGRSTRYPAGKVAARSDAIGARLADAAEAYGLTYLDLRPVFLEATRSEIIHGPDDWRHLSEGGYRLLAETLVEYLSAAPPEAPNG